VSAPFQPMLPPDSDPVVVELFARMQQQLDTQEKQLQADKKELTYSRLKIQLLEEKLRAMRIARYGKASETLSDLQLELLDLEPGVSGEEVAAESKREPLATSDETSGQPEPDSEMQQQTRKHPGRQTLPAHLARVEEIIACAPDRCLCGGCGKETQVIGYEESEVLDVKPAAYFVRVVKREKRACKRCEEQGVVVAPVADRILDKSLVSDQIIIDTVVAKYCDSLPLYRQSAILKRDTGLEITRSTMTGWVMHVGELLLRMRTSNRTFSRAGGCDGLVG